MESITAALGFGSGIDTKALVTQLVEAQFEFRNKQLAARNDTLTAQISAVGELKSGITSFASALKSLIGGGSLSAQAVSGDSSVFTVSALPNARLGTINAELEVRQLAASQVVTSAAVADPAAAVGTGTLTITLGTATTTDGALTGFAAASGKTPVTVAITAGNNSLTGIAAAINAANAGVTASVITDSSGSRLSVKGASGAEAGFTIDVAEDAGAPGLSSLAFNTGSSAMTLNRTAQDAIVALDGVAVTRPTNSISGLIPSVRIDLLKAEPGRAVSIGTQRPTAAIGQAVSDFVGAFNELRNILRADTDPVTGVLRGEGAARDMARQLSALTSTVLANAGDEGAPHTLAEIGVRTNRDGSLSLDPIRLNEVLNSNPDAVEAMINPTRSSGALGLAGALDAVADRLTDRDQGLTAAEARYLKLQEAIAEDQAKAVKDADRLRERLTLQFAGMDARVSAYKATQSFLDQQISIWTRDS